MEYESITDKLANDRVDKLFGDKDPELKAIVQMELTLESEDPEDVAKKTKFLAKMAKEHIKDAELLNEQVWNIHNEKGELIPHIYRDGKFILYQPILNDGGEQSTGSPVNDN